MIQPTKTLASASVLWEYMSSFQSAAPSDAVVVCCSYDLRVCDHACGLIESNLAPRIVLSGDAGNWTRNLWDRPEAHVFRDRAIANGISSNRMLVEDQATNLGENVRFSSALLPEAKTVTFVTKPSTVLRLKLTVQAQWPDVEAHVSCLRVKFPDSVSKDIGLVGVIDEMVGDVQRIRLYPDRGYQVRHELPARVLNAWNHLVREGFVHHLI